jgi:hypothetical protein
MPRPVPTTGFVSATTNQSRRAASTPGRRGRSDRQRYSPCRSVPWYDPAVGRVAFLGQRPGGGYPFRRGRPASPGGPVQPAVVFIWSNTRIERSGRVIFGTPLSGIGSCPGIAGKGRFCEPWTGKTGRKAPRFRPGRENRPDLPRFGTRAPDPVCRPSITERDRPFDRSPSLPSCRVINESMG